MSIVNDRRCDGCGLIRAGDDNTWLALIPAGWDGEDKRRDFCDLSCLHAWVKREARAAKA